MKLSIETGIVSGGISISKYPKYQYWYQQISQWVLGPFRKQELTPVELFIAVPDVYYLQCSIGCHRVI